MIILPMKLKTSKSFLLAIAGIIISIPAVASAFCPVCTVAVAAGVGLSRYLKIDDLITGTWIGAFMLSLTLWMFNWFKAKKYGPKYIYPLSALALYFITILPLYYTGIVGHPQNTLFGIDRLLDGMILGTILFMLAIVNYNALKTRNNNHAYFPFQKIAMAVGYLAIASFLIYGLIQIKVIR